MVLNLLGETMILINGLSVNTRFFMFLYQISNNLCIQNTINALKTWDFYLHKEWKISGN